MYGKQKMDRVPHEFRGRVAAMWKCCNDLYHASCLERGLPDNQWTMQRKQQINFYIGCHNGEWRYYFGFRREWSLSKEQLMKQIDLKHVTIQKIDLLDNKSILDHSLCSHDVMEPTDMELLMKLVVFLSNKPMLFIYTSAVAHFSSPKGAIVLKYLSKMTFSKIWTKKYFSVYNPLLENQFSRRKPTSISLGSLQHVDAFITEQLAVGNIKKFHCNGDGHLPTELIVGFINSFLQNPENYKEGEFSIFSRFEESTKEFLERELQEGRCEWNNGGYNFSVCNANLKRNALLYVRCMAQYIFMATL